MNTEAENDPIHVSSLPDVPELNELIKPKFLEDFVRTEKSFYLKKIFECYMNTEERKLTEVMNKFFTRLETADCDTRDRHLLEFIEKLNKIFPYDHGVFMIFFLNHFTLKKDEAIYIRPLIPYSFLYGDAVECTTNTDNDIKATFTTDIKEVSLFIEYADFTSFELDQLKVKPRFEPYLNIYDCDEDEFVLSKATIRKDQYYCIYGKRTLCVFIVIEGMALTMEYTKIKVGTIMLIPPCHTYYMKALEDMTIFMAEPNLVI
ncbi:mannose-6-phosphate isomerase isoform X2 [Halyomorpha halys]|uniref:mannose-6-phosphate isomerase isoform X2 n=1 Tax=Halyomorpha halys TaxID=286706 RepID=UPI0006D4E4F8|nr:mannose-6-phosphate isomerase isoform X2 [Halyomorpha halys]